MRVGERLVPMTWDVLGRIYDEGKADFLSRAAASGLPADDVVRLLDTQGYFDLVNLPYPAERAGLGGTFRRAAGPLRLRGVCYEVPSVTRDPSRAASRPFPRG
jgi:hypothetical protein